MANDYFQFKQFRVQQNRCAMKVGTDGTLLGSWATGGTNILDVGTGTGLLALMMAQRFPDAQVTAIDIDAEAVEQARENVAASPFAERIRVFQTDFRQFSPEKEGLVPTYDAIVCNPPYFSHSLECPDAQRTLARHAASLPYEDLMMKSASLLTDDGELSFVIPFDCLSRLEEAAVLAGIFKSCEWAVKTTPKNAPRRYLLAFRKHSVKTLEQREMVLEDQPGVRSVCYSELTKDFYL